MANLNVQLTGGALQVIDNTGNIQRVNSPIPTILAAVSASFYEPYFQVNIAGQNLSLPGATVWVVAIRNLSGAATITVICTPAGGAAWANGLVLVPGQQFMYFAPFASNPASGGVTTINVAASANGTPAEILLAA